jgi:hypothetical protein
MQNLKIKRNKVNNMKKYAKDKFYTEINENLKDIKSLNSLLLIKSGPSALFGFRVEIMSTTSCSKTIILPRVSLPLSSKSGKFLWII